MSYKQRVGGSSPPVSTVTVAELAMRRIVVPKYAGSNPVGHLNPRRLMEKPRGYELRIKGSSPFEDINCFFKKFII